MFRITGNKGFQMTFANGNTVSVQFGRGNYCENRWVEKNGPELSSEDAECLAWDKDENNLCSPQGWQTPDEIAAFIAKYSA